MEVMAQVLGPLTPMWETHLVLQEPDLNLPLPWLLQKLGERSSRCRWLITPKFTLHFFKDLFIFT